eukprot:4383655-Pyramimonas_sp.AAC.1
MVHRTTGSYLPQQVVHLPQLQLVHHHGVYRGERRLVLQWRRRRRRQMLALVLEDVALARPHPATAVDGTLM